MASSVPDQPPRVAAEIRAMDIFVAWPQQSRAADCQQPRTVVADMQHGLYPSIASDAKDLGVESNSERQRQQLILRVEVCALQPQDVLRVLSGGSETPRVCVDRADAGIRKRANAGVAVLRRMTDLGQVHNCGRAHVYQAERRYKYSGIDVGGLKGRCQFGLNVPIIVGIKNSVRHDAAQDALIRVAVGIDESGNQNVVCSVDDGCFCRHRNIRPHRGDLAILDQHVGLDEVSDLAVERQHHAAFEKDRVLPLQARQFGIGLRRAGALCDGAAGQYSSCGFACRQADARFQKGAT
jgi:hypothetical protein